MMYELRFPIYGKDAGWRSTIESSIRVEADSREEAIAKAVERGNGFLTADCFSSVGVA